MKIRNELYFGIFKCTLLLIIGAAAPLISWFSGYTPYSEDAAIFFQRSGSITVITSIWVEFEIIKIHEKLYPSNSGTIIHTKDITNVFQPMYSVFSYLAALFAILGTLIWGYGDLFVKNT